MLEDREAFALGAFESPEPGASSVDVDDGALEPDDGTVSGED